MFTTICSSHSLFCRLSIANTTIIKSFCNTVLVVRYMHNSVIQDFIPQILKTAIFCKTHRKFMGYDCIIANDHITNRINC